MGGGDVCLLTDGEDICNRGTRLSSIVQLDNTLSYPYDYVFIDVGGRDAPVLRSAIGAADTILVPMILSAADSWAADDIFRIFDSLAELGVEP